MCRPAGKEELLQLPALHGMFLHQAGEVVAFNQLHIQDLRLLPGCVVESLVGDRHHREFHVWIALSRREAVWRSSQYDFEDAGSVQGVDGHESGAEMTLTAVTSLALVCPVTSPRGITPEH